MVPMVAPDGTVGEVPSDRVVDGLKMGGKLGVEVEAPDGTRGIIPRENIVKAIQMGGKVIHDSAQYTTKFEQDRNPANQPGVLKSAASELGSLAKGVPQMLSNAMEAGGPQGVANAAQMGAQIGQEDSQRQQDNRSTPYRVAAAAVTPFGVNASGMEAAANVGNARGVIGTALGDAAPVAIGEAIKAPAVQERIGSFAKSVKPITPLADSRVGNVMPLEAGKLPPSAVSGAEDIFRAAAPTGMNKGFRGNVYAAVGDLADIGRKIDLAESKGGIINPDLRVRATVDAIRDHLDEMYKTERAPQIQRNADAPVKVAGNADAQRGLEYLESTAGQEQIRNLATKALGTLDEKGNRVGGGTLTAAEADTLAQAANQNLKSFERMTPEGKTQASITNPKIGGLKALDQELGRNLNEVLTDNGENGLRDYERRFAALSAVRDQLESRMNAVELERQSLGKYSKVITGGKSAIASASQAAVSSVNIGRTLQRGLRKLAQTELTSK